MFGDNGDPVSRLVRENPVFENDRLQEISFFSSEDVPVTVGLVIDNSTSMMTQRRLVIAGGMAFANSSHPEDELFTVNFNEQVRFGLPEQVPFHVGSRLLVQAALNSLRPGGRTALYDAVIRALDHMERANHQKRFIIVQSDGDDTASEASKEEMFARAAASDTMSFVVGAIDLYATGIYGNRRVLRTLARLGGGSAYFPDNERDVVRSFEEIAAHVRQYSIGYVPTASASDATFRRVRVIVRGPGRRGLNIRCTATAT